MSLKEINHNSLQKETSEEIKKFSRNGRPEIESSNKFNIKIIIFITIVITWILLYGIIMGFTGLLCFLITPALILSLTNLLLQYLFFA